MKQAWILDQKFGIYANNFLIFKNNQQQRLTYNGATLVRISVKDKIHEHDEAPASWLLLVYVAEYVPLL